MNQLLFLVLAGVGLLCRGAFAQTDSLALRAAEPVNKATYRVGPGDVLEISAGPGAARNEGFARSEPIGPDGRISFDLVGSVYVENKTSDEIDALLTKLLSDFIIDVEVTVVIASYEARRVFVLGEVGSPGKILIKKNMTIMDAITEAGSPTKKASMAKVKLFRSHSTERERQLVKVNLKKLMENGALNQNLALNDGDVIVVPPDRLSKWGYAFEKVLRPIQPLIYIGVITGLWRAVN
jgi:polysaccharide export outer membrane protein